MTQQQELPSTSSPRPKQGLRARLFAKALAEEGTIHERVVAPYKRQLLADLHGDVLEIGPGAGVMTALLAARCRAVTAVEVDKNLHGRGNRARH